jgi:hypothetical protein
MANVNFEDFEGEYAGAQGARASRLVNLAGAGCSVLLVLGMVVWGYKLAVRDVNGIPVVRALAGPLRVAPENPGGELAMHQGLSVNAVASVGVALPLPSKLSLAPADVTLRSEDAAGLAILASAAPDLASPDAPVAAAEASVSPLLPVEIAPVEIAPVAESSADIAIEAPVPETQEEAVAAALAAALADDGTVEADAPVASAAVTRSPRPQLRPERAVLTNVSATSAEVIEPTAALASVSEVSAASIPKGTPLVQLGAFDDEAGARSEWSKLQLRFPELIGPKALVVQSAQSGGRTFYRLRAHGFASEDETRRFCAALLAENASCIAVAQR